LGEVFNKLLSIVFYVYYYLINALICSIIEVIQFGNLKTTIANAKEVLR